MGRRLEPVGSTTGPDALLYHKSPGTGAKLCNGSGMWIMDMWPVSGEGVQIESLLISGSLRRGSVNHAVLETVRILVPPGGLARMFPSMSELSDFNPDDDRVPLAPIVADLRRKHWPGVCPPVLYSRCAGDLPRSFIKFNKPLHEIEGSLT